MVNTMQSEVKMSPKTSVEEPKKVTIRPLADVYETPEEIVLFLEMPNADRSKLKVYVKDGLLHIEGEKKPVEVQGEYLLNEIRHLAYERIFNLEEDIDTDKITAKYENGILTIHLAKKEKEKPKIIEIK